MGLYEQLFEYYEQGQLDDPVLIRAFEEARPNRELAATLEDTKAKLTAAEDRLAAAETLRRQTEQNHRRSLRVEREASKRALAAMGAQIRERQDHPEPVLASVTYERGEREMLASLGWSKHAGG
jgi:DNA-binding MarR family transcriptional regulator